MTNKLIVCGGTFDHFHKGHESLLKLAFSLGKNVIIGVTSDSFVKSDKRKATSEKQIESFEERRKAVWGFAKAEGVLDRTEIVEIDDLFGPTLFKNLVIDTIVVSEETAIGAGIINQERKKLGLSPLKVFIAPSVMAEDGRLISSARIRNGVISRSGKLYVNPLWFKTGLMLPEDLIQELKKPFGEILTENKDLPGSKNNLVITVGDETSKKFNANSISQNISVVDFKIARKVQFSSFAELGFLGGEKVIVADNPAGHITSDLVHAISKIFKADFSNRIILKIIGEEDLAVLPLILAAPLGTVIYYGQPNVGLVRILVSEKNKDQAYGLVSQFRPIETHTRGY